MLIEIVVHEWHWSSPILISKRGAYYAYGGWFMDKHQMMGLLAWSGRELSAANLCKMTRITFYSLFRTSIKAIVKKVTL
jgi:hypothetical protein